MLMEGGNLFTAGVYIFLSIIIGFTEVALGVGLARLLIFRNKQGGYRNDWQGKAA